jgi:ERCC4-related helicase
LGKTWVAILLAIAFTSVGGKVLIAAPNRNMQQKWGLELDKWYGDNPNDKLWSKSNNDWIKLHPGDEIYWGAKGIDAECLNLIKGRILLVTHDQFWRRSTPWPCDLLIMDEAHRRRDKMKTDFVKKTNASFKLFLTATPFGKDPLHFKFLLDAIGYYSESGDIDEYLKNMRQWDSDAAPEKIAKAAYEELKPWIIRHSIDNIGKSEKKMLGEQVYILGSFMNPEKQKFQKDKTELSLLNAGAIRLPESECGNRVRKLILCMERLKKLDKKNVLGIRAHQVLTAPYSTRAVKRIMETLQEKPNDFSPEMAFYINQLSELVESGYGPMEQSLKDFSRQCFDTQEKFIVFCHHHDTAKAVEEILKEVRKCAESENNFVPEHFEKAWKSIQEREDDHPRHLSADILKKNKEIIRDQLILPDKIDAEVVDYKKAIDDLLRYKRVLKKFDQNKKQVASALRIGYVERLKGDTRSNIARILFNTPFNPQALVITGKDSEGIDLHENCRIFVHYEMTYRPETVIQANGRIRRIGCLGAKLGKPILYYYPYLEGTRSEKLTEVVLNRVERFRKLLGGLPELNFDQLIDRVETIGNNEEKLNNFCNRVYHKTLVP